MDNWRNDAIDIHMKSKSRICIFLLGRPVQKTTVVDHWEKSTAFFILPQRGNEYEKPTDQLRLIENVKEAFHFSCGWVSLLWTFTPKKRPLIWGDLCEYCRISSALYLTKSLRVKLAFVRVVCLGHQTQPNDENNKRRWHYHTADTRHNANNCAPAIVTITGSNQ